MPPREEKRISSRRTATDHRLKKDDTPDPTTSTSTTDPTATTSKRKKSRLPTARTSTLDPLLLARGMSSRYLSAKQIKQISPLDKSQIDKDLRHMEAYRQASNGYNQQLFVFQNQELVRTGYFGSSFGGDSLLSNTASSSKSGTSTTTNSVAGGGGNNPNFSLPIKLDPEKEKSLAVLRKKIHSSEFTREKLETEYLSLRAHYVHSSQLLRKTKGYEGGRIKFLRELMERRGRVLGLMRVKVGMARDVERLIEWRGEVLGGVRRGEIGLEELNQLLSSNDDDGGSAEEFMEVWNEVEKKLKEAERACVELETPLELLQMVKSSDGGKSDGGGGDADKGGKRRKRSSSIDEGGEVYSNSSSSGSTGGDGGKKKNPIPSGMEPHVIPWDCMVEPQTPYEVPILLSCLSSATDHALGYVTDRSKPKSITLLTSTLPPSTSAFTPHTTQLHLFKEEARLLEEELQRETELNTTLQRDLIASRSRGDEMAALMQLMRSETEAVLERHNLIMETPEAREKAAELHKKFLEEQKLNNNQMGGGEEGDIDEEMSREEESGEEEEEEERSEDESVGIKEITVDKNEDDKTGESEEEEGSGSDGEMGEEPRRSKRGNSSGGDEESSSLTPPNTAAQRKRRRF